MKKIMMIAIFASVATIASAKPPVGGKGGFGGGNGFMEQLTDTQKACLKAQNCPESERPQGENGQKPTDEKPEKGSRPEMTEEQKATMRAEWECLKAAIKTCGIEMPKRPEHAGE